MATNENVNKVIYGNQTVMDITDTTAEESDVASGEVFYKANGSRSVGTLNKDSAVWGNIEGTLSDQTDLQIELNRAYSKTASETSSIDDLDLIPVQKISASSDGRRNIKFRNLKSVLKTYFDNFYSTFSGSYNDLTNKPTAGTGIAINNNVIAVDADNAPTENSEKPVKSKGVYSALESSESTQESLLKSTVGWTGKNLLENNAVGKTVKGVTFTVNSDGSITANGTATAEITLWLVGDGWNYSNCKDIPLSIEDNTEYIFGGETDDSSDAYMQLVIKNSDGTNPTYWISYGTRKKASTSVINRASQKWHCWIRINNGTTVTNKTFYPMLRDASITDDTYEPYHESVEEEIEQIYADNGVLGAKNLLKRTSNSNITVEGITFTVNADNSITCNGTSTNSLVWVIENVLCKGNVEYILTGCPSGGGSASTDYWLGAYINGTIDKRDIGNGVLLKYTTDTTVEVRLRIPNGYTANNFTFYPMIRLASDPDDTYVPYAMTNRELTEAIASIPGGGGMLPYLYIDSEAGATVTVNQPDGTTITPTAAGSGHWECELTGGYGTYVIHSVLSGQGDATLSLAVDTVKEYHVTDTHYDYTINVTAPSGSSIRITGGGETYTGTGTGSSQAFAVHTPSTTYTVAVTMDGNTKSETITSATTSGQSGSVTIAFGTINLTYANDFRGKTITCTKSGVTVTKTAPSSGNKMTFRVPTTGTWTISGTIGTKTYTVDATVSSLSTAVSVSLKTKALMYSFETCTDQQLADMLKSYYNGEYDAADIATLKSTYMPIGAKRSISLSAMSATGVSESHHADNYDVVIIGHEHDDLKTTSSGGKTKALLTLQLDRILYKNTTDATYSSDYPSVADEGGYMNSTNTTVGGWTNCARRSWCNDVFLNALPSAIKSLVKTVNKLTSAGNKSTTIETTEDNVFLLSEIEVFGAVTNSKAGEGSQYEYFTVASNIRKKPSYKTFVSAYWWERSPSGSTVTYFCDVNNNGDAHNAYANYGAGLAPAFCI